MEQSSGEAPVVDDVSTRAIEYVSRSRPLEGAPPATLDQLGSMPIIHFVTPTGIEFLGCGEVVSVSSTGTNRLSDVRRFADSFYASLEHDGPDRAMPRFFGGIAFFADRRSNPGWERFGNTHFVVPQIQLTSVDGSMSLTVTDTADSDLDRTLDQIADQIRSISPDVAPSEPPVVSMIDRQTSYEEWAKYVERALDSINNGALEKVVLAQKMDYIFDERVNPADLFQRLDEKSPNCFRFRFDVDQSTSFFGASPERLVAVSDATVETEAIAGSVPRGDSPDEDDRYLATLQETDKFRSEHEPVVSAIRHRLAERTESIVIGERTVRKFDSIQHLHTPISATLTGEYHILDLVDRLHPTPAVGGLPQERAMETISAIESFDRGWYAGPIGWFDNHGDGEFFVGIRCGRAIDRTLTLYSGNGIVPGSDPKAEWEEIELKMDPIRSELGGDPNG